MRNPLRTVSQALGILLIVASFAAAQVQKPSQAQIAAASNAFHEYDSGNTIDQVLSTVHPGRPGPIVIKRTYNSYGNGAVLSNPNQYPNQDFINATSTADNAFLGVPLRRWSYPTAGNNFVFSIYAVRVEQVLGDDSNSLAPGKIVYIARAGGGIEVNGRDVRGNDPDFHLFHLNENYLFMGKRLANAIFKVDSQHALLIHDDEVLETSTQAHRRDALQGKNRAAVLNEVREGYKTSRSLAKRGEQR